MKDIDKLPHWPRGLSRTLAASYVGVSPTTFDRMIKDGLMPDPKRVYGRVIWDKLALDDAFDILDGGHRRDEAGQVIYEFSNEPLREKRQEKKCKDNEYPILSEEEAQAWLVGYEAEKRASLLGKPMGLMEKHALRGLFDCGGKSVLRSQIAKGCTSATLRKLEWRGFVELDESQTKGKRKKYRITSAGTVAVAELI